MNLLRLFTHHALDHRPFHSVPPSIDRESIESYFDSLFVALSITPQGVPLPAGPQGEIRSPVSQHHPERVPGCMM